jgi:hypothetical protein
MIQLIIIFYIYALIKLTQFIIRFLNTLIEALVLCYMSHGTHKFHYKMVMGTDKPRGGW